MNFFVLVYRRMKNDLRYFEVLDFYMFHCFNISKHISISVLFLITSAFMFCFLLDF